MKTVNYRILKLCGWSGIIYAVLTSIGFVPMANFLPPPSPNDTAIQTTTFFLTNANGVRFGMVLSMIGAVFLMPYAVAMALHMRRIEGKEAPALSMIQFGVGTLFVLAVIYLLFFWLVATFRIDRAPELIQLLNDMAWIPFIGISSTLIMQAVTFGWVILIDKRNVPIFPRWLGFFNLWAAVIYFPGSFNVFFLTGPLAWDGWLAFYLPISVFMLWMVINSIFLIKAVDHYKMEYEANNAVNAGNSLCGDTALMAELKTLRAEIDLLKAK